MSAFVPGFDFDVFVSYAHVDNVALVPGEVPSGWVHTLVDGLKKLLHQKLGSQEWGTIWMDPRLTGDLSLTPAIQQVVTHSATLLVILSEGYLNSKWCAQERELFCEAAGHRGGYEGRVFVVQQTEIDRARWPEEFQDLISYKFFEKDRDDVARTLGIPIPNPRVDRVYFERLDDLSRRLGKRLRTLRAAVGVSPSPEPEVLLVVPTQSAATVFLADTTVDLEDQRDNIKRQLEQSGLRVLPETYYYNRSPADFKAAMEKDLAESVLFVQLLGPYSTRKTVDLPRGYEGLQLDRAQSANKPIMRWRDRGLDVKSVKNQDLLAPDVMVMPFGDFKREVQEKVRLLTIPQSDKPPSPEGEAYTLVNANTRDSSVAGNICEVLRAEYHIGYDLIDEKTSLLDLVESENYGYDALVVIYGQCEQDWAQKQIRACRQVMLRKRSQTLICAVYVGPPPNKEPLRIKPPRFHFFNNPGDAEFKKFIRAIETKEVSGHDGHDHRFGHDNRQVSDRGRRNQPRLNKEIDDLQKQWDLLSEKLSELNKQKILETRTEEKFRLGGLIDDTKTQRDQVEKQLKDIESQLTKVDSDVEEVAGRNDDQSRVSQ